MNKAAKTHNNQHTGILKWLQKYGPSCVLIDTTQDKNKYGAKLTLLVRKPNTEFICVREPLHTNSSEYETPTPY